MRSKHVDRFKVGDWVAPRGVSEDSPEYDIGRVVDLRLYTVTVQWQRAAQVYSEDPINLVRALQPEHE